MRNKFGANSRSVNGEWMCTHDTPSSSLFDGASFEEFASYCKEEMSSSNSNFPVVLSWMLVSLKEMTAVNEWDMLGNRNSKRFKVTGACAICHAPLLGSAGYTQYVTPIDVDFPFPSFRQAHVADGTCRIFGTCLHNPLQFVQCPC